MNVVTKKHVSCNAHTLAAEAYKIELQQQDSFKIMRRWSKLFTVHSVCVPHILISRDC